MENEVKTNQTVVYEVGEIVEQDGQYVCVPCGIIRFFKQGRKFPGCLNCMEKRKRFFFKNLELWEKVSD